MYMKNAEAAIQAAIVAHHPKPVTPPPGGVIRTVQRWGRDDIEVIGYGVGDVGETYDEYEMVEGAIPFRKACPSHSVMNGEVGEVVLKYYLTGSGGGGRRRVNLPQLEAVVVRTGITLIPVWTSGAPVWAGQSAWGCQGSAWDSGEPANLETLWGLPEEVMEMRAELIRQLS